MNPDGGLAHDGNNCPRYLYLTRHGDASADESALPDNGRRQAVLLGERLRGAPLTARSTMARSRARSRRRSWSASSSTVFPCGGPDQPVTTSPNRAGPSACRHTETDTRSLFPVASHNGT